MKITTNSIIDIVESVLNKKMKMINPTELVKIKNLRISKTSFDGINKVDSNDLSYFNNLEDLSIEGCMIDEKFINNLSKIKKLKRLHFIECDFVDEIQEYFNNLAIKELLLFNCLGLNDIAISNIDTLTIAEIPNNITLKNINNLDLRHCISIDYDIIQNFNIKNLIINQEQVTDRINDLLYSITIKNNYDEVIKVINHD